MILAHPGVGLAADGATKGRVLLKFQLYRRECCFDRIFPLPVNQSRKGFPRPRLRPIGTVANRYNCAKSLRLECAEVITIAEPARTITLRDGYRQAIVPDATKPDRQGHWLDVRRAAREVDFRGNMSLGDGLANRIGCCLPDGRAPVSTETRA